ncbi:MAG: hypothetical protein KAG53_09875 [Endozoicomonadaceae bacterium]|nr:hypothetical protein [Endozoicomonadaceae bacterium]
MNPFYALKTIKGYFGTNNKAQPAIADRDVKSTSDSLTTRTPTNKTSFDYSMMKQDNTENPKTLTRLQDLLLLQSETQDQLQEFSCPNRKINVYNVKLKLELSFHINNSENKIYPRYTVYIKNGKTITVFNKHEIIATSDFQATSNDISISSIEILPRYKRYGIGTYIITIIKSLCIINNIPCIFISHIQPIGSNITTMSALKKFYGKNGFEVFKFCLANCAKWINKKYVTMCRTNN